MLRITENNNTHNKDNESNPRVSLIFFYCAALLRHKTLFKVNIDIMHLDNILVFNSSANVDELQIYPHRNNIDLALLKFSL